MSVNSFGAQSTLTVGEDSYQIFGWTRSREPTRCHTA